LAKSSSLDDVAKSRTMATLTLSPPFTLTTILPISLSVCGEVNQPIDAGVRALLLALVWLCVDQRAGPPLELVFIAFGEIARAVEILRRPVNLECDAGKGISHTFLDQRHGKVRYIDADLLTI
jgi:hypothetical protein